ncbi:MAG: DUF4276 family protein [Lewinellaceae bacterium]|nr:DUF4276 family protein [Lewinellaceae bacterium]
MASVHIITEGPTEKNFVDDVLKPYLAAKGVYVDAHSVTTRRDRRKNKVFRGGLDKVDHLLKDIRLWLLESANQPDCYVTTMVDLYAFPYEQKPAWVEGFNAQGDGLGKATFLEEKLREEFPAHHRFIPYIQLHEYEALLLTDTSIINEAFKGLHPPNRLAQLNNDIGDLEPEEVNQGQHSAPSKRIIKYYPEYEDSKSTWGPIIAVEIGIDKMRERNPHFDAWVTSLEALSVPPEQ